MMQQTPMHFERSECNLDNGPEYILKIEEKSREKSRGGNQSQNMKYAKCLMRKGKGKIQSNPIQVNLK
jgi:hypothetical protein